MHLPKVLRVLPLSLAWPLVASRFTEALLVNSHVHVFSLSQLYEQAGSVHEPIPGEHLQWLRPPQRDSIAL